MKQSQLLQMMFEMKRWEDLIVKADEKGIDKGELRKLCEPHTRLRFYQAIISGNYEIAPPHIARIPKDNGDYREVYVNENIDRIFLTLVNDCLCELFSNMVHPQCRSYQKGTGCQETVQRVSKEIVKLNRIKSDNFIGYKADLSKYFDTVKIEIIEKVFDEIELKLDFEIGTEPVISILRNYYHNDLVFDIDKNLIQHYGSLKQGCAVAAFLSNVVLYEVDRTLNEMDIIYYRYSDDILMIGNDAAIAKKKLEGMLELYGLKLNPKKVESLYSDKWFTFLGFKIKGSMITLSKNRIKNFQKEIEKRTIKKRNISSKQARQNVINYLYKGEYNWSTSCLGTINCKPDIDELNKFIMDCIRACETGKKKLGGLGSVNNLEDRTILRGTGRNVTANKTKTEKLIENYLSVGCLSNNYKISKVVYEACVRSI